jgi:hypothetical protein
VDTVLVEQAFGQLLENAAKYSPVGTEIKISGRRERDYVMLSVQDQGSGLTADERGQLGRRSFRGRPASGWCKRIGARSVDCQHLHCRQWRQPACGKSGAESRDDDIAAAADGDPRIHRRSWTRLMTKVLVIDDEAQIRRFLRAGFELHGFTVLEAENAAVGLKTATFNSGGFDYSGP